MKGERGNGILKFLDHYAGIPLVPLCAAFRKWDRKIPARSESRKIGILCLGAIGDLLLVSALVDGIHKACPEASIEMITSKANACAAPLIPHIAKFHSYPISGLWQLVRQLRRHPYSLLFDTGQWARISALITALSGAENTVGFRTRGQRRSLGYDVRVLHGSRHEIDNFCALGRAIWPDFAGKPSLDLPQPKMTERVIACHMWPSNGKGRILKEWPADSWVNLISILLEKDWQIRLTGSCADTSACNAFKERHFPRDERVQSITGLPLKELGKYFTTIGAVVSVNSGPMHLAALAGVPTVGLHGATNPGRWGPVGPRTISIVPRSGRYGYLDLGFEYPARATPAMANLPVKDVLESLEALGVF